MKQTFTVTGMTCGSCKASVTKHLSSIDQVEHVLVDLEEGEAYITSHSPIETSTLQGVLPKKFTLSTKETSKPIIGDAVKQKTKLQQLQPLLLILGYIATASILLHYSNWSTKAFMLDFMGLFFIVFSFFKLLDLKNFPTSFSMYDPLAKRVTIYAWLYPFIETALGLMLLMRFEITIALGISLVVLSITTIGVTKTLLDKKSIQCACLGTALKLPMTEATFIENAIMLTMASVMLYST